MRASRNWRYGGLKHELLPMFIEDDMLGILHAGEQQQHKKTNGHDEKPIKPLNNPKIANIPNNPVSNETSAQLRHLNKLTVITIELNIIIAVAMLAS